MNNPITKNFLQIAWYRITHHKISAIISIVIAYALALLILYILDEINPGYKISYKSLIPLKDDHDLKYNFYSGEKGSTYYNIGSTLTSDTTIPSRFGLPESIGLFDDNDTLENIGTSGGYENLMKVTSQKNSFSLVQDAVIRLQDDQLLKSIKIITPLFEERLHIFYRKDRFSRHPEIEKLLSANTDPWILDVFRDSIKNIQIGKVGSCTRIIAGDVMDLIERQIHANRAKKTFSISYRFMDDSISHAFSKMIRYKPVNRQKKTKDTAIDIMFYVGADPTDDIKAILDSNKYGSQYGLMSVSPSFLSKLNSVFKLNLQVADFQKKYDSADHVTTVGTFTSLIASRDIGNDDIERMLRKISDATMKIQKSFIHLPANCHDSCYSGLNPYCIYILPLAEFGFYKYFEDSARESNMEKIKTLIPFLIALFGFFYPILKSVSSLSSIWRSWQINQKIDRMLKINNGELTDANIRKLGREIANGYGNGDLLERHYNALEKRISANCHDEGLSEENKDNPQNEKSDIRKAPEQEQFKSVISPLMQSV